MVCSNCNNETDGIKLNEKLYCTQCGFELEKPNDSFSEPKAKIINSEGIEKEIDELGAELKALDMLEKQAKTEKKTKKDNQELNKLKAAEELINELNFDTLKPQILTKIETSKPTQNTIIEKKNRARFQHPKGNHEIIAKKIDIGTLDKDKTSKEFTKFKEKQNDYKIEETKIETLEEKFNKEPKSLQNAEPINLTSENEVTNNEPKIYSFEDFKNETSKNKEETKETEQKDSEFNLMYDEKGYCVKCKSIRGIKDTTKITMKNGHPAVKGKCNVCGTTIFKIKKGIAKINKRLEKQTALTNFFKQNTPKAKLEPPKVKKKFNWKLLLGIIIPVILILSFIALVLYVNYFGINPERAKIKAEEKISFNYQKPDYIPAGYQLSYETNSTSTMIDYVYQLTVVENGKEQHKNKLNIIIRQYSSKEEAFNNFIKNSGKEYKIENVAETEIWLLENKAIFFDNGILYEINSSDTLSKGELVKIAKSIIE